MPKATTLTAEMIHHLAKELMFDISDEQCANLLLEFKAIAEQMKIVTEIDTDNIEPLDYPLSIVNSYLRPDVARIPFSSKTVLEVAPQVSNDYVVINQVINHEN
ncbi:Asp-tRNA(Asn)/Glu-tRNA(Gln) amidotransferase subunit GatC [Spiroplasma endosymbiont of Nebria brevicollis]|uniref:Asp-tRNA(Asn)/Glu-tRNA(Gln) amidotransferase subunit GatC n=1 Tax=Spiroplasma endosymbiont of Nebria brevicollis TaxID=3066284 RepID=UPI00313BF8B7